MAKSKKAITKRKTKTSGKPIEQYEHLDKERVNNPHIGLVNESTDTEYGQNKKTYQYDPHLDPQLQWAGKAEKTSFDVPLVSLHVHERIDPKTIIDSVRKDIEDEIEQLSLFEKTKRPLREAVEFYKHKEGWTNRIIAGDSLLVMNSLIEKESMGSKIQMIYFDPPYGINYRSNFQPFTNKRDVKDTDIDEDLTSEPEMLKAFRDTWDMGIHSYLTYIRDRVKLGFDLLKDDGSFFIQIGNENVHLVRIILDEIFGAENFYSQISFRKKMMPLSKKPGCESMNDYILWYVKNKEKAYKKIKQLFINQNPADNSSMDSLELTSFIRRPLTSEEKVNTSIIPSDSKLYQTMPLKPREYRENQDFNIEFHGKDYPPMGGNVNRTPNGIHCWSTTKVGLERIKKANRLEISGNYLRYVLFHDDYPVTRLTANWNDTAPATNMKYVVETSPKVVMRCILMATDPGDIVLDITCGSGVTALESERFGRRWITCDSSRIALAIAKQNLMTAQFDFYELMQPDEGISSGFKYSTVPHITSGSIANNQLIDAIWDKYKGDITLLCKEICDEIKDRFEIWNVPTSASPKWNKKAHELHTKFWALRRKQDEEMNLAVQKGSIPEILFDKPKADNSRTRVSGPFTVESIPAQFVKSLDEVNLNEDSPDGSIARQGETYRQDQWRDELLKTGVRGKSGAMLHFTRIEAQEGTRYIQASGETKESKPQKILIVFGPEHAPLDSRVVELAIEEARQLKPNILLFCAFQFDEEAAKDIDETSEKLIGFKLLKAQMNMDLQTDDLKKQKAGNQSFWLIGQPDVRIHNIEKGEDKGKVKIEVAGFDYYNPKTGAIESEGSNKIAMWMLDTDYDGRSLFPRQIFFPMAGSKDGWSRLARNLKAEIDEEKVEAFHGTVSLPFTPGKLIAVKIIDDRGIESLKIIKR